MNIFVSCCNKICNIGKSDEIDVGYHLSFCYSMYSSQWWNRCRLSSILLLFNVFIAHRDASLGIAACSMLSITYAWQTCSKSWAHKMLQLGIADQFGETKEYTKRISINYWTTTPFVERERGLPVPRIGTELVMSKCDKGGLGLIRWIEEDNLG